MKFVYLKAILVTFVSLSLILLMKQMIFVIISLILLINRMTFVTSFFDSLD
jgi:hypothetical protein